MGVFLEKEKNHQAQFLRQSGYFGRTHPLNQTNPQRLPQALASQNIYPAQRGEVLDYFERHRIRWPRGSDAQPSPDLCDITVNCINFLYPFSTRPKALADLMSQIYPTVKYMLPFEDGAYVSFFWPHNPDLVKADAAVLFFRQDSQRQLVLIHWNYCESYAPVMLLEGQKFDHLFDYNLPIKTSQIENKEMLYYAPFLRFLEVQVLARQLEREKRLSADIVSVLQILPISNMDLMEVVSPGLHRFGISPSQIWQNLVQPYDRFCSIFTENLFGHFDIAMHPDLLDWWLYLTRRYPWVVK